MSYYQTCPLPKPEPRKKVKARKARADAKGLKAFRDAIWKRNTCVSLSMGWHAHCEYCHRIVFRNQTPMGEAHHRIPRSIGTKLQRYDPANGVLLCPQCHGKAQRKEIQV